MSKGFKYRIALELHSIVIGRSQKTADLHSTVEWIVTSQAILQKDVTNFIAGFLIQKWNHSTQRF